MPRRAKQLILVILAQTACVAVGLWMEHQFVKSSVYRAAEENALADLATTAHEMLFKLGELSVGSLQDGTDSIEPVREVLAAGEPLNGGALIVDRGWRIVVQAGDGSGSQPADIAGGQAISLTSVAAAPAGSKSAERGTLARPDGPHIAVAVQLSDLSGHLVVHRSQADVLASSAALVGSLPALSGVTLLWTCALLGVVAYLVLGRFQSEDDRHRKRVASDSLRQTQNLVRTRDAVIFGLANLADSRDPDTGDHLERISTYSTLLASILRRHPRYRDYVTPAFVRVIGISSVLHDIGKVGIEDRILRKPGALTPEERVCMETHTTIGGECLREIEQRLGGSNFLQMAREIAFAHHERWDGKGYPAGLAGEAIPLAARIVAIVDVYDALSTKRVYKPPFPHEECVAIIRAQAGKHFDPELLEVWLTVQSKFREIAARYAAAIGPVGDVSCDEETDQAGHGRLGEAVAAPVAAGEVQAKSV